MASISNVQGYVLTGKQDDGDQIEDEEQLLGLKGEQEQNQRDDIKEEKDGGIEMQVCAAAPRVDEGYPVTHCLCRMGCAERL